MCGCSKGYSHISLGQTIRFSATDKVTVTIAKVSSGKDIHATVMVDAVICPYLKPILVFLLPGMFVECYY